MQRGSDSYTMKKIIILALGLGFLTNAFTQGELWGVSQRGGDFGAGSVYKLDEDGQNPTTVHTYNFDFAGMEPKDMNLAEWNGVLYGTTFQGGTNRRGVLFSYDLNTQVYTILHNFDEETTGNNPSGSVVVTNGKVFGTTWYGGPNGTSGTLFAYDITLDSLYLVEDFDGVLTSGGSVSMMVASDGNIYGGMQSFGAFGDGLIFKLNPVTEVFSILYELDNDGLGDGLQPENNLLEAEPGILYATTEFGGAHNNGVLYAFDYTTSTFTKLFDFNDDTDGRTPTGSLAYDGSKLYGVTDDGGNYGSNYGLLYSFDLSTNLFDTLFNFYPNSGYNPDGGVFYDGNGLLYGTVERGDATNDDGAIFTYDIATNTYTVKVNFGFSDFGSLPTGNLVQASNGKVYGGLANGGPANSGSVYEYTLGDTIVNPIISFEQALEGANPQTAPTLASNGKLYGVIYEGGAGNVGLLYEVDPATGTYTNLVDFDSTSLGENPNSQLVEKNGILYGTLSGGGSQAGGCLFSFDPNTGILSSMHDFNVTTFASPTNSLTLTASGNLIGACDFGGANNFGGVYEYDLTAGTMTFLVDFDEAIHGFFQGMPFYEVSADVYYIMMRSGLSSIHGKILQFDRTNNQLSVVHDFAGPPSDGTFPSSNLVLGSDGLLYGVTSGGGSTSGGTIYSIDPATNAFTIVTSFPGVFDINGPSGLILFGPDGKLYGVSPNGGPDFNGLVFSYDFASNTFSTVYQDDDQLKWPDGGLIYVPDTYQPQALCQDITVDISGALTGAYYPSDLDGGSTDNSSRVFVGLSSQHIAVETTNNSGIDEYFDDGIQYYYEEGTLIVGADMTLTLTDALLGAGSASSIVAIYSDEIEPLSGLIDNRANLVGYALFTGGNITAGSNTFTLLENTTYYLQLGSQNQQTTGVFELEADLPVISDLSTISVDCDDTGSLTETLYVYDRAGNVSTCTSTVDVIEDEDPSITADLSTVAGSIIPCGKADYEVVVTATDNCGDPTVLNVIEVPQLTNPTVLYKVRSTNALKYRLNQNAVKVFGPDPQGFWDEVQANGGIAVDNGQIITYREGDVSSTPVVFNFDGSNALTLVKNDNMTMLSKATDASGNTASTSAEAFIPCNASPEIPQAPVLVNADFTTEALNIFPNPTNGLTQLDFYLASAQWVQCQMLDLNGKVVKVLFQGYLEEGPQRITWDSHQLSSGMYLVQLQTEGDLQIQKIQISH